MHDQTYFQELSVSNKENGYRDIIATIDISSYRRIPWEHEIPFFLCSFFDPDTKLPIAPCPRNLLRGVAEQAEKRGLKALAGLEYEFFQFKETTNSLAMKKGHGLQHLTPGMFGYSLQRTGLNQDYYHAVFDSSRQFGCPMEAWHTETGPGVYECALEFTEITQMADRGALFKFLCKSLGPKYGVLPSFMAKPSQGLPGNSGHIHISLVDKDSGANIFARDSEDKDAKYNDLRFLSDIGRSFLAGVLEGLGDIMPLLAPTINSYKRLVENFWAPVVISWGLEHRAASVRLIAPPTCAPKATRLEIRVPGSDSHPHYAMAGILALGLRGIGEKLTLDAMPPLSLTETEVNGERLAKSLQIATDRFMAPSSIAREVLGDAFVDHYGSTRRHEIRQWEEAVTDWEVMRYTETV